ncbi:MAG: CDP-diacylglycerol--glycerol-3-phosphate 3-phosphatidyltransferase [Ignavibacteriales bacterium]|nr:CDP-diacylglycerol--glycerol-3-phosphate 3-phosphatidyltransferase [Ignavibacteriales bacterium]
MPVSFPDLLTLLRIVLSPLFLVMFLSADATTKQLSLVVFLIAALTDWYDGWVARRYGYFSRWGKFLDPLADKILAASALFAFVLLNLVDGWMVWVIVFRDILITALRSYAEYKGKPVITSLSAKTKTFGLYISLYYILLLHVASFVPSISARYQNEIHQLLHPQVLFGMMLVVTIATTWTGFVYLIENRKTLRELFEPRNVL